MTEDEFGRPDAGLGVLIYGNAVAIVLHRNLVRSVGNINVLDGIAFGARLEASLLTDTVIKCIDKNLIKDLEEARAEADGTPLHRALLHVDNPSLLNGSINGADVGIRKFKNVLAMRMLLVLSGTRLCSLRRRGFRSGSRRGLSTHSTRCVPSGGKGGPLVNFVGTRPLA